MVGVGLGGWGGGGTRSDPPEGNMNVQTPPAAVRLEVDSHLSSFREHPFDAELGVFLHSPWQLAHKTRG